MKDPIAALAVEVASFEENSNIRSKPVRVAVTMKTFYHQVDVLALTSSTQRYQESVVQPARRTGSRNGSLQESSVPDAKPHAVYV